MYTTPPFIEHYINQLISEQCVIDLQVLKGEYYKEIKKLNENLLSKRERDQLYKKATGKENVNSVENEEKRINSKYIGEAKRIAEDHAKIEGKSVHEYTTLEDRKERTEKNMDSVQEKMLDRKEEFKAKEEQKKEIKEEINAVLKETKVENNLKQEDINKESVLDMQEKSAKEIEREKKLEELRQQFAQNRDRMMDKEP